MQTANFFVNRFGDRYLYEVNRGVFDQVGAAAVFKRRFGEALFAKDCLNIVVGTDSGLLVRYLVTRGIAEGSRFLFLELDELLPVIEAELADLDLDDNILICGKDALEDVLRDIRFADYANIDAVRLVESLGAHDDYLGGYRTALAKIRQELDSILWVHGAQLSNPSFVRRQLENLVEQHVPASALRDRFTGKTAVLLGGGPSLDAILPWVGEHRDQLMIIAVSRISRRLRDVGVTPHIVVSIDPTELSFDISKELLELDPRIVLAHANHVAFPLLAQWPGRSVFLDRRYPWAARNEPENLAANGPTVTNTGFALARAMGFSTVVLGGIDLCHSSEGYSHARGSNEFDAGPMLGMASLRVPTNAGRLAETTPDFFNAITAFGRQASAAAAAGLCIINPAEDAAVIDGVSHLPLDALDFEPLEQPPFVALHACLGPDDAAMRGRNYAAMRRELARAHKHLREIEQLAEQALDCNDGLFGRNGKTADFRYKQRMDKIERQLDNRLASFTEIVKLFSARAFLHMPPSDREWTDDEIEQAGVTYYTAYRENARGILKLIEQAQTRLAVAAEEDAEAPDFERLITQWQHDNIPGRARVWRHRHPQLASRLAEAVQARFAELDAAFQAMLATRDTSHARKMRNEASLGPVRGKLQSLLRERNRTELDRLTAQLGRQSGEEAAQLHLLGLGYLAELDDEPDTAFAHYGALVERVRESLADNESEAPNPRLEDALRRMTMIALAENRNEDALLILGTLTGMAPVFSPQYAELLRLSGDYPAAAEVYSEYLQRVPGDHATMLRLGRLYREIGADEAARTAFAYVLQKDPDNRAAQTLLADTQRGASA